MEIQPSLRPSLDSQTKRSHLQHKVSFSPYEYKDSEKCVKCVNIFVYALLRIYALLRTFTHSLRTASSHCVLLRTFAHSAHFRALSRIRASSRTFRAPWECVLLRTAYLVRISTHQYAPTPTPTPYRWRLPFAHQLVCRGWSCQSCTLSLAHSRREH